MGTPWPAALPPGVIRQAEGFGPQGGLPPPKLIRLVIFRTAHGGLDAGFDEVKQEC
jgi:hypothetical protein